MKLLTEYKLILLKYGIVLDLGGYYLNQSGLRINSNIWDFNDYMFRGL